MGLRHGSIRPSDARWRSPRRCSITRSAIRRRLDHEQHARGECDPARRRPHAISRALRAGRRPAPSPRRRRGGIWNDHAVAFAEAVVAGQHFAQPVGARVDLTHGSAPRRSSSRPPTRRASPDPPRRARARDSPFARASSVSRIAFRVPRLPRFLRPRETPWILLQVGEHRRLSCSARRRRRPRRSARRAAPARNASTPASCSMRHHASSAIFACRSRSRWARA